MKFTYQGNLRQGGFLVNGNRSMVFRIYDSSFSAVALWTSPADNVSLSTGVFRVALAPVLADWQSGNLWLELEVEGNRMSPREEITSSPYSINTLMLSGKRYTTAASSPAPLAVGDLWMDSVSGTLKFWNGAIWMATSGSGIPGAHAFTHEPGGSDLLTALATHTVSGALTFTSVGELRVGAGLAGLTITTNVVVGGTLNPSSPLFIGGGVFAPAFTGDGSALYNLDASKIYFGTLSADRIGSGVLVSSHIADGTLQTADLADASVTRAKLAQDGCAFGQILQWNGAIWACVNAAAGGAESDPLSIHNQDFLQAGTTFYVSSGAATYFNVGAELRVAGDAYLSSGTVTNWNVTNALKVYGTAQLNGSPGEAGLAVNAAGNVGIGVAAGTARLQVRGEDTQAYSLAVGTGAVHQVVVSTTGAVGIGTEAPRAKMEVTGAPAAGEYIAIFNSGNKLAAWLRNK